MKRSRKSHTKSRGGCVTCKIRRKKCDETRPTCSTCLNAGRECGGYDEPFQHVQITDQATLTPVCRDNLKRPPRLWLLESDQESLYFGFFIRSTAPAFSSYYDSTFWKSVVLPQCFRYPVVKQAALALGAIHRLHALQHEPQIPGNQDFALQAYVKAIKSLHQTLESPSSVGIGLVVSILFAAFEAFQDNHETSAIHLAHGLRTVFQTKPRGVSLRPSSSSSDLTEFNLRIFIEKVYQMLGDFFDRPPTTIEEDSAFTFASLNQAYDSLSTQWITLSEAMTRELGHIDYSYYSAQLFWWREAFVRHLATTEEFLSARDRQQQRLLKLFHDSISLLILCRANRCGEVAERSSMSRTLRHANLNAHFSKLTMLADRLAQSPDTLTHLSNGQLRRFSLDSGLLPSSDCSQTNMASNSSKIYDVAEKLTAMESQVAITNNLVPADAMWIDVATSLEDDLVTLRYCTCQSSDSLVWIHKTIKL